MKNLESNIIHALHINVQTTTTPLPYNDFRKEFLFVARFLVLTQVAPGTFCTISYRLLPPPWSANVALAKLRHSRIHTYIRCSLKKF